MQTEPAFTETELALRWNVSIKTLQRWRSEERGPPYIKLSKAIRYPVDEIVTYEQAIRQGMAHEVPLPSLNDAQPVVESPAPAAPEPKRYYLSPDGHPKLPHLWPVKLLQAGRSNYDDSVLMAMRAAASLRR